MRSQPATRPAAKAAALPAETAARPRLARLIWVLALGLAIALARPLVADAQSADTPGSFADLAESVSPAVVNITTSTTVAGATEGFPMVPEGSPFEEFFRDFLDRENEGERPPRRGQALGSGFVITEDGFIVTNNHVIDGADEITIEFFDGLELAAELVGSDPLTDIALLKVEHDAELPHVPFGNSADSRVGDWVIAVGNPLGQGFSVSAGIISARGRALQGNYDDYIQTDAAINRGNSGGPLFNMDGEVIGVNTAILSPTGGSIGIGFAMSSNVVVTVIDQLREFGTTRRGWLGVRIQDLTDEMAEAIGLDQPHGALVTDVMEGPSREAGMQTGDVIVRFDDGSVRDTRQLVRRVGDAGVGRTVEVVVFRDGEEVVLDVVLGQRELAEGQLGDIPAPEPVEPEPRDFLGMTLEQLSDRLREELGLQPGLDGLLVQQIDQNSDAWQKGIRVGDLITEAGQQPVREVADLEARADEAREAGRRSLLVLLRRGGDPRFVALSIEP